MKTLYEFYQAVEKRSPQLRRGQAACNLLYTHRPFLANEIRNTNKDPFYKEENWDAFVEFVEINWYGIE